MTAEGRQRWLRGTSWVAGAGLALAIGLHLLLPYLLNTPVIKTRMLNAIAHSLPGEIQYEHVTPALLPRPHAELHQLVYKAGSKIELNAASMEIQPAFWPLLAGRLKIKTLRLRHPVLVIDLPLTTGSARGASPALRQQILTVLDRLEAMPDGWNLVIQDGMTTLRRGQGATIGLNRIELRAAVKEGRLNFRLGGRSDLVDSVTLQGTFQYQDGKLVGKDISAVSAGSTARNGHLDMDLSGGLQTFRLAADLDVDLHRLPAVLAMLSHGTAWSERLEGLPPLDGRATGRLVLGDRLDDLHWDINMKAGIRMLDADIQVSGPAKGMPGATAQADLTIRGRIGPQAVAWLNRQEAAGEFVLPKGTIDIQQARLMHRQDGQWTLDGAFSLDQQMEAKVELAMRPGDIRLEKLHIRDDRTNARISLHYQQNRDAWSGDFNGHLDGASLDRIWPGRHLLRGWIEGDLQGRGDRALDRLTLRGKATISEATVPLPSTDLLQIHEARVIAEGETIILSPSKVSWRKQAATLSGEGRLRKGQWHLDLKLESPSLDSDDLTAGWQDLTRKRRASGEPKGNRPFAPRFEGRLVLDADEFYLGKHRFAPLKAEITHRDDQTDIHLSNAELCGITTQGSIAVTPDGIELDITPSADKSPLAGTADCLAAAGITERIEGRLHLDGKLSAKGRDGRELVQNLNGRVKMNISDGKVYNVGTTGVLTNLLSYFSVNQLVRGSLPDLREDSFHYNRMESQLVLKDGWMQIEKGAMKADSVNVAGHGRYNLTDQRLKLTLLVSPLTTVDWVIERLPLVGRILEGTLVAIPVGVSGSVRDPAVLPLAPSAIGSRVGGILKGILETPYYIIEPLLPDKTSQRKDAAGSGTLSKGQGTNQ